MTEERSLANVLKALPDLLRMEQTWGLLATIIRQWGIENVIPILLGTVRKMGIIDSVTRLLNFKLDKLFANLVVSTWDTLGDREAIISGDKRFTFKEYEERVFRLGNGLQSLGLEYMDRVAIMLYNTNEHMESMFGSWFIGCTTPDVNWHLSRDELATII